MLDWTQLGIGWGLTLVVAATVNLIMRRSLLALLRAFCGTDTGAHFWGGFFGVLMVVGPMFLVSVGMTGGGNPAEFMRRVMALICFGLIGTLFIMGVAMATARLRQNRQPE